MSATESIGAPETIDHAPGEAPVTDPWPGPAPGSAPVMVPGYLILCELGRGGMGIVYKALQVAIHRTVALKMILSADVTEYHERFRAEAESAARLQHPNIVQLYEFGEAGGRPFFSLEFVDGGSLADRLNGVPQPIDDTARLVATVARAMQYAHERGVVHRDLKPANILLEIADGQPQSAIPKIADFGLAKRLDEVGHTGTGMVLGTPSYMSPEQASGNSRSVGPATDVYALGAILYECLTGRPPFRGGTALETILQVSRDVPVPPRRLRPDVPRDLETICLRCLAKDAGKRYLSAQALADDLQRFLDREPIAARPASTWERVRVWGKRHPARAVALAALAILAVFLPAIALKHSFDVEKAYAQVQVEHRRALQQLVRRTVASGNKLAGEGDYLWSLPWFTEALRMENDPERIPAHRIRIAALLRMCPKLLQVWSHEAPVVDACFSVDGQSIAAVRDDGSLRLWSAARPFEPARVLRPTQVGAPERPTATPRRVLAFSPDGRWLISQSTDGTYCFKTSSADGEMRRLGDGKLHFAWGKDNLLFLADDEKVMALDPTGDDMAPKLLKVVEERVAALAASPATGTMAVGTQNGSVLIRNDSGWNAVGDPIRMPKAVRVLRYSHDGKWLIAVSDNGARVVDAATWKFITPWLYHSQPITDAAFSPDGHTVATASNDDTAKLWNVATGELLVDPLKHNSDVFRVAFSPDGRLLATCSDDGTARVWDVRTGAPHSPPLPHSGSVNVVAFANVGHTLLTASEDGTLKLWELGPARESILESIRHPERALRAKSADGRYEVVAANTGEFAGQPGEYRVRETGDGRLHLPGFVNPGGAQSVAFSPDASRIVTGGNDRTARIWDWRTAREVAGPLRHGSRVTDAVFSGDGRLIATASDDNSARVWNAETGAALTPPLWHNGTVQFVRFNVDGTLLLAGGKNEMAYVWEIATGDEIAPVRRTEPWVIKAIDSRSPVGSWDLPADERLVEDLIALAEWLSGHRVDPTGGLVPLSDGEYGAVGERVRAMRRP